MQLRETETETGIQGGGYSKEEISKLQVKQLRLLRKDLTGLSLKELQHLEQQLSEGLLCVKEKKDQLLVQQLEHSRAHNYQRIDSRRAMLMTLITLDFSGRCLGVGTQYEMLAVQI